MGSNRSHHSKVNVYSFIPCFHADPYFGTLAPGESAEVSGGILFTEEPLEEAMKKINWGEWIRGAGR